MSVQNIPEAARVNGDWIERAHRILQSNVEDVLKKAEFHGVVTIDVVFRDNRIIGIDPTTRQTIRR